MLYDIGMKQDKKLNDNGSILNALTVLTTDFVLLEGTGYYEAICRYVVETFAFDYAFVGKLEENNRVNVLSGWAMNKPIDTFSYNLQNTPCQNVIALDYAVYAHDVQIDFPEDELLLDMNLQGYAGIALTNKNNEPLGLFVVLSENPLDDVDHVTQILKLYVASISAEMQRFDTEKSNHSLKNLAYYDPLTKLPNRLLLTDRLTRAVTNSSRTQKMVAVCLMDLDGFKEVNDTLGHEAGDFVLVNVSRRIEKLLRAEDTIARLGGDEYVIILTDIESSEDAARILFRILNAVSSEYQYKDIAIKTISASIGVTLYPEDKSDEDLLLRHADQAMYKAKEGGKNQFYFFDLKEHKKVKANFRALSKIEKAIENQEFEIYFQPKISSHNLKIEAAEVLTRWNHNVLGTLLPSEFLPLIENDDIIFKFDKWVIKQTLLSLKRLRKYNLSLRLSVNISSKQFKQRDFVQKVKEIADSVNIDYSYFKNIEFEITESSALESINHTNEVIAGLKQLGITIALDDFGTGYSSLTHLKELHVDCIKIDKSFVMDMLYNSQDMSIVNAIISLSKVFQIEVVAEGAENIEHLIMLFELGADTIQGYSVSRPLTFDQFIKFIENFQPDPKWSVASYSLPQRGEFELLLAQSNHRYWIDLVIDALNKRDYENLPHLSHEDCRLGRWIELKGKRYFSTLNSFENLIQTHKKIHREVINIVEALKKNETKISYKEITHIINLKNEFVLVIEQLREEYRMNKLIKGIKYDGK